MRDARVQFLANHFGDKAAFLDRDRSHTWKHLALFVLQRGEIADDEDFRMLRNTEVRLHQNASGAIDRCAQLLAERGGSDSCRPKHHRSGESSVADINRPGFDLRYGRRGTDLDSQTIELFLRAAREVFGIGRKNARSTFNQQNVRARRIDGAKFVGQGVAADFGQSAGQFDSRRAAADNHEVEWRRAFAGGGLALGQFEGEQHAAADFQRIFNRLESGSKGLPLVVSEVGVGGACGHDQVVVGEVEASEVSTMRRSRSNPVTSDISTSIFLCERRIERMGAAISPGESPAVATW